MNINLTNNTEQDFTTAYDIADGSKLFKIYTPLKQHITLSFKWAGFDEADSTIKIGGNNDGDDSNISYFEGTDDVKTLDTAAGIETIYFDGVWTFNFMYVLLTANSTAEGTIIATATIKNV